VPVPVTTGDGKAAGATSGLGGGRRDAAAVSCENGDTSPPGESLAPKMTKTDYRPLLA
jgi:hypothetical protein